MLRLLRDISRVLSPAQVRQVLGIQALVLLMAFMEIASVVAIAPFMSVVADMSRLEGEGMLARLYELTGIQTPNQFLLYLGIAILLILVVSSLISMYGTWMISKYSHQLGAELSTQLFSFYLNRPWLYHTAVPSSILIHKIAGELPRFTGNVVSSLLHTNAAAVFAVLMIGGLVIYDPVIALVGVAVFGGCYWLLFSWVRARLKHGGVELSRTNQIRYKLITEALGGIKELMLLGRQQTFVDAFRESSRALARVQVQNATLSDAPRYAIELAAFGSLIALVLYLLSVKDGDMGRVLPTLAVYAFAAYKLLPAFQQIYRGLATLQGGLPAFRSIEEDLRRCLAEKTIGAVPTDKPVSSEDRLSAHSEILFDQVSFRYPSKTTFALDCVDLRIPARKVIGLVGPSGSGKSTTVDLLLGLVAPDMGQIKIDGQALQASNLLAWQRGLGFVPQRIFLADASIRENIAFGVPVARIDDHRVRSAARMAHLDELLASLPLGLETQVGERGIQLSGGQSQRVGIARALYHDADLLVLDEATAALDGITEQLIMDAIHDFSGTKTIVIIAHRLTTVKDCDIIYFMQDGRIVDQGRFEELASRNEIFRKMALID